MSTKASIRKKRTSKTVSIGDFVFLLRYTNPCIDEVPVASSFIDKYNYTNEMSQETLTKGRKIQQNIHDGKYDDYIQKIPFDIEADE